VGGVLAIAGPGGTVQAGEESGQLLRLRKKTLEAAFASVWTVMLDFPLLLAAETNLAVGFDSVPARVAAFGRNRDAGNRSSLLDSAYLAGLLDDFRQASLLGRMDCDKDTDGHAVNRDDLPLEFALWFAREGRRTSSMLSDIQHLGGAWLWVLLLLSVSVAALVAVKRGVAARRALGVFTSGLTGAAISTLAVVIYQTRFGSLYSEVSLLVGGFMLGAALGGWLGTLWSSWGWFCFEVRLRAFRLSCWRRAAGSGSGSSFRWPRRTCRQGHTRRRLVGSWRLILPVVCSEHSFRSWH
jgi:hypothetical protein